ncbi:MAG: hypothetical protein ABIU11_03215 [Chitinophagaceae bacterium]
MLSEIKDMQVTGMKDEYLMIKIDSGKYHFEIRVKNKSEVKLTSLL